MAQITAHLNDKKEEKYLLLKSEWEVFRRANPHIYKLFHSEVTAAIQKLECEGLLYIKKIPVRMIFENIKWYGVKTLSKDGYTVNNDYFKLYAFLFQAENPMYAGIFEHRGYIPIKIRRIIRENQGTHLIAKKRYQRKKRIEEQKHSIS